MNLEIIIPGKGKLDLYPNTKIPVRLRNPMFNTLGSHSLTFNIPATAANRHYFKHTEIISRQNISINTSKFELYYKGLHIYSGIIKVKLAKDNTYICYLQIAEGVLYASIHDKTLNTLDSTKFILDKSTCYSAEYGNKNYTLGLINNIADNSGISDIYNFPIANDKFLYSYDNETEPYSYEYPIPFFKVYFLIQKIAEKLGYSVEAPLFNRYPELFDLVVINMSSYNNHLTAVNYIDGIPKYKVKSFLKDLINTFNLFFVIDNNKNVLYIENIDYILSNSNIKENNNIIFNQIERSEYKGHEFTQTADSNDDLSTELKYITLLGEEKNTSSLGPIPMIEKGVLMQDITFSLDPSEAPGSNTYKFSPQLSVLIPSFNIANDVKSDIKPRILFHRGLQTTKTYLVTTIRDENNQQFIPSDFVDFAQDYINGFNKYPFLTQDITDAKGNKIPSAEISLKYEGANGLIEHFWKKTLHWEENIKVKIQGTANFKARDLKTFDMLAKYKTKDFSYIISTIDFNLGTNNISPAVVIAFRI